MEQLMHEQAMVLDNVSDSLFGNAYLKIAFIAPPLGTTTVLSADGKHGIPPWLLFLACVVQVPVHCA